MRCMTVEAAALLCRNMRFAGIGVDFSVMAGVAEAGSIALEKRLTRCRMAVMASQAFALIGRSVHALDSRRLLSLLMAGLAYFCRSIVQHAFVLAGMYRMACLAVSLLDRLMP